MRGGVLLCVVFLQFVRWSYLEQSQLHASDNHEKDGFPAVVTFAVLLHTGDLAGSTQIQTKCLQRLTRVQSITL